MDPSDPYTTFKGITPPISVALPTPAELASNDALIEELKRQKSFESSEETERRKKTLHTIQKITVAFVKHAMTNSTERKFSQSAINSAGGKIFTFGSYRLGVYGPGSDIDTLAVVPKDVSREDFFEYFPLLLEKMSPPGAIEEIKVVKDAFVPIIKLEYCGISIDLIFARLAIPSVPMNLDLKDVNLLKGLDDQDMRSLNGTRVTDEILELVPQQKTFRTALRAVKLWAQRRAIYANIIGFPGGVAWAMLVARVCQLYPKASGSVLVGKFFRIMSKWNWPQPVMLKDMENGPLQVRLWNPKLYRADRYHLMPVITPAYPSMCATHNITMSTKKIIMKELARGGDLVDKIFTGQLEWKDLFGRHTFFTEDYKYYIGVVSTSRTKEAQLLWSGLVESKVRHLVGDLEQDNLINIAHPFNKGFERAHRCKNEDEVDAVIHGDLRYQATDIETETTDLTNDPTHNAVAQDEGESMTAPSDKPKLATDDGESNGENKDASKGENENKSESTMLFTTTYYIGLELNQTAKVKLDVSWATNKFKELCTQWPTYDPEVSSISVVHTRNYDLPADVFVPGEVKPTNPKKASKKGNGATKEEPANKKRKLETGDVEEHSSQPNGIKRRQSENGLPSLRAA